MSKWLGPRWQIATVVVLFVGAVAVLVYDVFVALHLPQQEQDGRVALREAGELLAAEAAESPAARGVADTSPEALNQALRKVSRSVLADFPGVEGGFYVADGSGSFAGYAYPTSQHPNAADSPRNDPPPLELPLILAQLGQTLDQGSSLLRAEDVGPSRVLMYTRPVGEHWPARLAVWLLYRVTGPEQTARQLRRTEVSMGLALAGMLVALALMWNLGLTLRRQRLEQHRLQDELRRAEHLAGLGKLLAGVAHEVRNPLAAIRSTVQLWQRLPDTTRTPESLESLVAAVDRINTLIGRLLYFSRADNAQREPVDVNRMLADTLELVRAQAGAQGVALESDFATDLPPVLGSTAALQQVALNLLTNALQAMPAGGRLHTSTRALPSGRAVEVRIADSGPGVAPEARAHLFEPFYTTRTDGTGLGLALCREIVLNHGGTIELLDAPGAVFRVVLPCA